MNTLLDPMAIVLPQFMASPMRAAARPLIFTVVLPAATLPYAPAPQAVHPEVPVVSALYMPMTHAVQAVDVLAEATLPYLPSLHTVHADVPVVSELYAPATHAVHTADVLPVATLP